MSAPVAAHAAWPAQSSGGGGSIAAIVEPGNPPVATVAGRTVQLSWTASNLSNGTPVGTYVATRYDSTGTVAQPISSGSCSTTVSGTECSETLVPPGVWRYVVTPVYNNWRGGQSPTTSVSVGSPALTVPSPATRATGTVSGSIANFGDGETLTFRLDGISGPTLSGTVDATTTPAPVPPGGSAAVTVTIPAGTSEGSHTIYAVASPSAENASAPITIDNTPPPTPTITAQPLNPTTATTAGFSFTGTETGATFECRLDAGTYSACSSPKSYSGLANGSHTFEVRALDAVGNPSAPASYTWTVDAAVPTAAITFPVSGASYNNAGFDAGCASATAGDACGTASDAGTGVAAVRVSLQQGTGNYWDGAGFSSATEVLFLATGTTAWTYAFAAANFPADGSYTLRARPADAAGNSGVATSAFSIDRTAPTATTIQTANASGGVAGKAETGDTLTFTYSEQMDPASILAGWSGGATPVVVRLTDGTGGLLADTLQVWNAGNSAQLPLGSVDLGGSDYVTGTITFTATMTQSGSNVVIALGTPSNAGSVATAVATGIMTWTPSTAARDVAGNACAGTVATESGALDREF